MSSTHLQLIWLNLWGLVGLYREPVSDPLLCNHSDQEGTGKNQGRVERPRQRNPKSHILRGGKYQTFLSSSPAGAHLYSSSAMNLQQRPMSPVVKKWPNGELGYAQYEIRMRIYQHTGFGSLSDPETIALRTQKKRPNVSQSLIHTRRPFFLISIIVGSDTESQHSVLQTRTSIRVE